MFYGNGIYTTSCILVIIGISCEIESIINLSNYVYPELIDNEVYNIAMMGTNDIHGSVFGLSLRHPLTNLTYTYGGLDNLVPFIKIMRNEWKERFLWLDSGDQFQGGIESIISNGSIITDFFNVMNLDGSTIGNHEFDFGKAF